MKDKTYAEIDTMLQEAISNINRIRWKISDVIPTDKTYETGVRDVIKALREYTATPYKGFTRTHAQCVADTLSEHFSIKEEGEKE